MTKIESITPIIREVESLFSTLNDLCFGGELETPIIIISPTTRKTSCLSKSDSTKDRVWKDTDVASSSDGSYEIKLSSHVLNESKEEICAILLHEMAHLYCAMRGLKDTNQNGSRHNKTYRDVGVKHGLCFKDKDKRYGWNYTSLAPDTKEALKAKLEENGISLEGRFEIYRPLPSPVSSKATGRKSSSRKYVCQFKGCNQTVRGTKDSNIICGIHNCKMVLDDDSRAFSKENKPKAKSKKEEASLQPVATEKVVA